MLSRARRQHCRDGSVSSDDCDDGCFTGCSNSGCRGIGHLSDEGEK